MSSLAREQLIALVLEGVMFGKFFHTTTSHAYVHANFDYRYLHSARWTDILPHSVNITFFYSSSSSVPELEYNVMF